MRISLMGNVISYNGMHYPVYDFALSDSDQLPIVKGVLLQLSSKNVWVSADTADWTTHPVQMKELQTWDHLPVSVFSIKKHLLWKIGLDLLHKTPVRVVNYQLKRDHNQLYLEKVFVGWKGLITYFQKKKKHWHSSFSLDWSRFQAFYELGCNTQFKKMEWFHPADIADMLRMLPFSCQLILIRRLKPLLASQVMRELEAHFQYPILDKLPTETIMRILSIMPTNHASAILREYKDPEKMVQLIPQPQQDHIKMQLQYDPSVAGAWMDTDYISFSSEITCEECLTYLRLHPLPSENIFYIYIENDQKEFVGVVSIRSIIMANPETKLEDLMKKNLVTLTVQTPKNEVATVMSRYHLLALPVLDEKKKIAGVIKIHDVLASTLEYPI